MGVVTVIALLIGAVGIAAFVLAMPRRRWEDAMERLSSSIRTERAGTTPGIGAGESDQLPVRSTGAALAVATGPRDAMDRFIDRFIDLLRGVIRTKSLPRRVLVGIGVLLVAVAVLLFSLSFSGGSSDGEDAPPPGSVHAPSGVAL